MAQVINNQKCPNSTIENAQKYVRSGFENTYYLGYRDLPFFIEKYVKGKRAIDYGCGTGRSTRFLKSLGLDAIGLDISAEMLSQALSFDNDPSHYLLIRSGQIPLLENSCDLAFSCFVFLTISNKEEITNICKEICRCLKNAGIFIIVTGSEKLYSHDWLSYNVRYPQNTTLTSGSQAKIKLKDLGLDFINYFWKDKDYTEIFKNTGFRILEKHFPLGNPDEKNWKSELQHAPYVIYILQKSKD